MGKARMSHQKLTAKFPTSAQALGEIVIAEARRRSGRECGAWACGYSASIQAFTAIIETGNGAAPRKREGGCDD